jgi:hypothetical protein
VYPVRQHDHEEVAFRIDPDRSSGETGVPEGALAHVLAAARASSARVPSECTRSGRSPSEELHRRVAEHPYPAVASASQHCPGEDGEISGGAEEARATGHASLRVRARVVHLAAQRMPAR